MSRRTNEDDEQLFGMLERLTDATWNTFMADEFTQRRSRQDEEMSAAAAALSSYLAVHIARLSTDDEKEQERLTAAAREDTLTVLTSMREIAEIILAWGHRIAGRPKKADELDRRRMRRSAR